MSEVKEKKKGHVHAITLILVLLFLGGAIISWRVSAARGATSETQSVKGVQGYQTIPKNVAGLRLKDWTAGQAAVKQMSQLHGKDISMQDGYIAKYAGGGRTLTAWVGKAADDKVASDLLTRMTALIKGGNPAYGNLQEIRVEGHPVYAVDGASDRSFYFQSGPWVIWLQTTGKDPLSIVTDGIVKLPSGGPRTGY